MNDECEGVNAFEDTHSRFLHRSITVKHFLVMSGEMCIVVLCILSQERGGSHDPCTALLMGCHDAHLPHPSPMQMGGVYRLAWRTNACGLEHSVNIVCSK
jgi:hypothetical protein